MNNCAPPGDFFMVSSALLCVLDAQATIVQANPAWLHKLGIAPDSLTQTSFFSWIHPLEQAASAACLKTLESTEAPITLTTYWRDAADKYHWLQWEITPTLQTTQQFYAVATEVTQQKQVEQRLRDSEERFQLALQGSNHGLWDWDLRTNEVYFAPRWKSILGYAEAEINNHLDELCNHIHPKDFSEMWGTLEAYLDKRLPNYESVYRMRHKNGDHIWVLARAAALWDSSGQPYRMVGTFVDITQRKQIEQVLQEKQAERDRLFNLSVDMQAIIGFNGDFKELNTAWNHTLGWPKEALFSKTLLEFIHPADRVETQQMLQTLSVGKTILNLENRFLCRSGIYKWLSWNIYPLVEQQTLYAIARDITETKQASEEIYNQREFIRLVVDAVPNLIFVKDRLNNFIFANQAVSELMGISVEKLMETLRFELNHSLENYQDYTSPIDRKVIDEHQEIVREEGFLDANGEQRYFHMVKKPFIQKNGETLVLTVGNDITERKAQEQALHASQERLDIATSAAPLILFALDKRGIFTFSRGRALRTLGFHNDELVGQSFFNVFADMPSLVQDVKRTLSGESLTNHTVLTNLVMETKTTPLIDEHQHIFGMIGVSVDITSRHKLQLRLRETVAELETILDNSVVGIAYIKNNQFIRVNSKLESLLEYQTGELKQLALHHIYPSPEDYQRVDANARRAFREGHGYDAGCLLKTKTQKLFWARMVAKTVDSRNLDKGTIWMIEDITLQKQAEQNLRLTATVFETTVDGILITDTQQRIQRVNPAFTKITGYTGAEVYGQSANILASGRHDKGFYQAMWESIERHGHWQGEVWNRKKNGEIYIAWLAISAITNEFNEIVQYMAVLTDISRLQEDIENARYLASYDSLTGLPNRMLFHDNLLQAQALARRNQRSFALLFIDLDGFKPVNDKLGHAIGDLLLQQIAYRLRNCLRESDTVARLGGDEFTVILHNITQADDAGLVADKILQDLKQPFWLDGHRVEVSASIGIAIYPTHTEQTVDTLLKQADRAMYQAKNQGKGQFCYYHVNSN